MDMSVIILIVIGAVAVLFIGLKIRKEFKSSDCDSCCGNCSKGCNEKVN